MNPKRYGDWMQTFTGRKFHPLDPDPQEIDIVDIAHALSMICRYNGHSSRFYSVAEHSVLVSESVPQEHALWGLLHDASEAYLGDVIRPLKPYLAAYGPAEKVLMRAVCERFGLPEVQPVEVTRVDNAILADEQRALMPNPSEPWRGVGAPLGVEITGWSPGEAKLRFLERFRELTGEHV